MSEVLLQAELPGMKFHSRGKVRDIFDLGDHLLIVTTDRISAFDVVLPNGIVDKGRVLNGLSAFWFEKFTPLCRHHLVTVDVEHMPQEVRAHCCVLAGRAALVKRCQPFPIECVVRGYLSGSGWKEYRTSQSVCGIALPAGMEESARLPEPIFTPSTKATTGHDENIPFSEVVRAVGGSVAERLRALSLRLYMHAADYARERGIIIADTKFEFGLLQGEIVLIDEVLTPDSSRFWPLDGYQPGSPQPSFDKQYVRDYLESVGWNKQPPAPKLPADVIQKTSQKYREAYRRVVGVEL